MNATSAKLIGALIGAGVGYFVGNVIVEVIYIREHRDELDDAYGGASEDENVETEFQTTMGKPKKRRGQTTSYTKMYTEKPELRKLVEKYSGEIQEDESEDSPGPLVYENEEIEEPDMPVTDPSIIYSDEYMMDEGYAKITLKYYDEDDVVTDEHDNPIDRPEQILGEDALVSFGVYSGDEDTVYIRNESKKAMYEIIRMNKAYSAPVHQQRPRRKPKKEEEDNGEESVPSG